MADSKKMTFALAGNPNCGKTTLFNSLTGSTAYVGNWPGVTVEKRSGTYKDKKGTSVDIIDLPGIYSLSPYTPEEVVSRNYILEEQPDCVINVLDATNLERNLYMTTQILEMDVPVVVALNMMDAVEESGVKIDTDAISKKLGVPVVSISALREKNLDTLIEEAIKASETKRAGKSLYDYGSDASKVKEAVEIYAAEGVTDPLFHAIKALEGDEIEAEKNKKAFDKVKALGVNAEEYEAASADKRYKYITSEVAIYRTGNHVQEAQKLSKSDKIDKVLTNRWAAIPIMIVVMFLIFHFTFSGNLFFLKSMGVDFGDGYTGAIHWTVDGEEFYPFAELFYTGDGFNSLGTFLQSFFGAGNDQGIQGMICIGIKQALEAMGAADWFVSFVYDGVLNGISAVLGFVPQILLLFAFFAILEDSGYMARIAFVLDRIFRKFGVSGRAFLPMIMGLGCGVPAMINTRTLASDKERTKTIRVIPFFTCGAKATFLVAISAAMADLFSVDAGIFTFAIYLFGFIAAIVGVIIMNNTTQREKVPPFIMELPAYHMPQPKALGLHVWDKGKHYIKKAFTIIFASTVIIWFLSNFTPDWHFIPAYEDTLNMNNSILAQIGMILSPLFTPMGFGNYQGGDNAWMYSVASIQGIVAKENVTSTLAELAGLINSTLPEDAEEAELVVSIVNYSNAHNGNITAASMVAFTVFNMTTIPCFASIATAKGELADRKAYLGTIGFWVVVSYILGCLTYITFKYTWTLAITLPVIIIAVVLCFFYNRKMNDKEAQEALAA